MSNESLESATDFTAASSKKPEGTTVSETSGLDSIVMALQALQKGPSKNVADNESATTTATTTSPPLPNGINSTRRVVSTDTIGDNDQSVESEGSKDEETVTSPHDESTTKPAAPSSPSPILPSEPVAMDGDEASKAADFSHILADPERWLRTTENLFAKLPPVDRSSDDIVVQPNDVLCGRGGETNHHPGNIRYRSLVKAYQKLYLLAKRRDKPKIAQCIVVSVRGVNGRFLKRTKNANKGSAWVDVGNVKAREKTSQALREGAPNLRENVNPPVNASGTSDSTIATDRLVSGKAEGMAASSPPTTALRGNTPTALETMMGWRLGPAGFNGANGVMNANGSKSSAPGVSSPSLSPSDAETEALTAQVFTNAAAKLMQHPAFHQLDPTRQHEAILFELKNAKATVESAKQTPSSTGTTTQGGKSPMAHGMHPPNPANEYSYYPHGQHQYYPHMYGDANLQNVYHELLAAKAAAATGSISGHSSGSKIEEKNVSDNTAGEHKPNMKKRPAPSSLDSSSVPASSLPARSPTVVSDTGSDTTSCASSTANNSEQSISAMKIDKSGGGSRLKRLKLRMKDDFNQ